VCCYDDAAAGDLQPSCPSREKREIPKPLNTGQIGGPRHTLVSIEFGKLTKSG